MEQLNIEGKRSGEGFVAHKAMLVTALSRALAERVMLMDLTLRRKGFLGYLKALGGSNVVKITPSSGSASGSQTIGKRLKVTCGANVSWLADGQWIRQAMGKGNATPLTFCEVRVSPSNAVKPNVGAMELAEALNRVLPFTSKDNDRPILNCVKFEAKEGKLSLISADGFRLAVATLDYDDSEGQALINGDDLKGIANALRRAKRARIAFEDNALILDTELIHYKWNGVNGSYPDWQRLIPSEVSTIAHFDTTEAIKAIRSLKALADSKSYPIDLHLDNGYMVMANPDDKGQTAIPADTEGEPIIVRIDGGYLAEALKACGGMVDFKVTSPIAPTLFTANGYQIVVMPMQRPVAKAEQAVAVAEAEQAEAVAEAEAKAEGQAEQAEAKPRRSRKTERVAVA